MNNNIIAKIIGSIITVIIMAVIIVFVYQYYDKEAKYGKRDTNNSSNTIDDNVKVDDIEFNDFEFKRVDVFLDKNRVIIDIMSTDAGDVLVVNDEAISYVNSSSVVRYCIFNNYLIFDVITDDIESIYLINKDVNIVSTYESIIKNESRYVVSKPIISCDFKSSIVVNDSIYIVYVLENMTDFDKDTIVQYVYKARLDGTLELYKSYKYDE